MAEILEIVMIVSFEAMVKKDNEAKSEAKTV